MDDWRGGRNDGLRTEWGVEGVTLNVRIVHYGRLVTEQLGGGMSVGVRIGRKDRLLTERVVDGVTVGCELAVMIVCLLNSWLMG